MTWTTLRRFAACAPSLLFGASLLAGCGALEVSDPAAIEDSELANADGADLMRRNALSQLYAALSQGAIFSGLLTDEFLADPSPFLVDQGIRTQEEAVDRREGVRAGGQGTGVLYYEPWQDARLGADAAIPLLRAYAPPAVASAHIGQMFAVRGFATLALAEDFCPGLPLNEVVDGRPAYRPPLGTDEIFARALADFDSAIVYAADSGRIADLARVGRARSLLGLGEFAEAAVAAAQVGPEYVWNAEYAADLGEQWNALAFSPFNLIRSVADHEGGNGFDFVSAGDPRVQTDSLGTANDGVTPMYSIAKYPDANAPVVLASGLEAQLIEAEGALNGGDPNWLTILNDLRATRAVPPLDPLADPGSAEARVDLLFRERAFWLFATGHRLGDLRRLVRHYGRASESVFPTGAYRLGGDYGGMASLDFLDAERLHNPAVTGCRDE